MARIFSVSVKSLRDVGTMNELFSTLTVKNRPKLRYVKDQVPRKLKMSGCNSTVVCPEEQYARDDMRPACDVSPAQMRANPLLSVPKLSEQKQHCIS